MINEVNDDFLERFLAGKIKNNNLLSITYYRKTEKTICGFYVNIWSMPMYFGLPDQYWFDSLSMIEFPFNNTRKAYIKSMRFQKSVCKCLGIPKEFWENEIKSEEIFSYIENNLNKYNKKLFNFSKCLLIKQLKEKGMRSCKREFRKINKWVNKSMKEAHKEFCMRQGL